MRLSKFFGLTSSSAVAKRPRGASCLSVVRFIASIVQYLERSFFIISYFGFGFTIVRTIRFSSVVFGVTSSLAVIHTIHGRLWLCIVRERAWSVSRCRTTVTVTGYRARHLVVEYLHTRNKRKAGRRCDLQSTNHAAAVTDRKARYSLRIHILFLAYPTCIRRPR